MHDTTGFVRSTNSLIVFAPQHFSKSNVKMPGLPFCVNIWLITSATFISQWLTILKYNIACDNYAEEVKERLNLVLVLMEMFMLWCLTTTMMISSCLTISSIWWMWLQTECFHTKPAPSVSALRLTLYHLPLNEQVLQNLIHSACGKPQGG